MHPVSQRGGVMNRRAYVIAFLSAYAAAPAARAQLITVKSAPIADGGQFAFHPSANLGLGALSIALADSSLDPFTNPAKGSRLTGTRVFGAPTFFSVSRRAGGGLTLPLGLSFSSGKWFSQMLVAMQEVDNAGTSQNVFPELAATLDGNMQIIDQKEVSRTNKYLHGLVGRRFTELSVAASASYWGLNAIDGAELFYGGNNPVRESGGALDMRVGVFKDYGRQSFEAIVLHNRVGVDQDVAFIRQMWDPSNRTFVVRPELQPNADRTRTTGLHLGYTRRLLSDSSWRVGAILTGNRISQPSLPGYALPQVPADAGHASAFNVGGGIARTTGPWTYGFDAIYEPIWSRTWVNADKATETVQGQPIEAGANTLDSRFRYSNAIARAGFGVAIPIAKDKSLTLETGGQLHAFRYNLDQRDAIQRTQPKSSQHWNEWTRTWGASVRLVGADLRYRGSLTTGAGRPGFDRNDGIIAVDALSAVPSPSSFSSFAPFGLVFDDVRAFTHQISLSVPIR
jgi:hypothetical protein